MLKLRREKKIKECPRCKTKTPVLAERCSSCNLEFSRLTRATNKQAKKELLSGSRQNVVFVNNCPKDVNKLVLILLAGFLGAFGAHNLYIGRYGKGVYSLAMGIFSVFYVSYPNSYNIFKSVMSLISLLVGIMAIFWMFDFVNICLGKYKIPVAMEEEK